MHTRSSFHIAALCLLPTIGVHADVLEADVIIRVKGASLEGTRITVQPEFGDAFPVHFTKERFPLEFGLQATYLLRAEHDGCPTKEILFDCNVPAAYEQADYFFPLQILLERLSDKEMFEYAQPVGLVYFDEIKEDFVYFTDHTKVRQAPTLAALQSRMGQTRTLLPEPERPMTANNDTEAEPAAVASMDQEHETGVGQGTMGVQQLRTTHAIAPVMESSGSRTLSAAPIPVPLVVSIPEPGAEVPIEKATEPLTLEPNRPAPALGQRVTVRTVPLAPELNNRFDLGDASAECETMQIITADRCIIRIDRLPTEDGCVELRKVTHHYGAVFYFHDGRSVTQELYLETLASATSY